MNSFSTILNAVMPVFAIMVAGLGMRQRNWLSQEADHSLFRVVVNVLLPCLILDTALGNPALNDWRNLLLAPAVGIVTVLFGVAMAWLVSRGSCFSTKAGRRTFAFTTGLHNYSYLPLPLALLLFDDRTAGVLLLHNVGVELCLWTVLLAILTGGHPGRDWCKFINPPFVAILLALALNFTGANTWLPASLLNALKLLGQCAIPLALILVGATIADYLGDLCSGEGWASVLPSVLLRMGLLPMAFLVLAKYMPMSVELRRVIVIEAAMPAAVLPIILARHYGGDPAMAMRIVMSTSVISLVTTPLWIRFGLQWTGF